MAGPNKKLVAAVEAYLADLGIRLGDRGARIGALPLLVTTDSGRVVHP